MNPHLDQFLEFLNTELPEICTDKDLANYLPEIFKSACNLTRMRARKQTPTYFLIEPHFYYLKADVLAWLKEKYQCEERQEKEEALCSLK